MPLVERKDRYNGAESRADGVKNVGSAEQGQGHLFCLQLQVAGAGAAFDQENAMKGLEGKKNFGHQNSQKSEVDDSRSQGESGAKLNSLKFSEKKIV